MLDIFYPSTRKVINNNGLKTIFQQIFSNMRTNESGATSNYGLFNFVHFTFFS